MNMKRKYLLILPVLAVLLFAITQWAQAKGRAELVEIEIPRHFRPLQVDNPDLLEDLSMARFEAYDVPVVEPAHLGGGVVVTRFNFDEHNQPVPFDKVIYFAHTGGARGYVFYLGIINGYGPEDGKWFRVSERGEAALWAALEQAGVDPQDLGVESDE